MSQSHNNNIWRLRQVDGQQGVILHKMFFQTSVHVTKFTTHLAGGDMAVGQDVLKHLGELVIADYHVEVLYQLWTELAHHLPSPLVLLLVLVAVENRGEDDGWSYAGSLVYCTDVSHSL